MEGKLGVLYQNGEQVAGVYDWEVNLAWDSSVSKGWQKSIVIKRITAQSYWLVEPIKDNEFEAEFYQTLNNQLVLMDAGKVKVNFPDIETINRRLYAPIDIRWLGFEY